MKKVYVAVVMDKYLEQYAVNSLLVVASSCGRNGYDQIIWPSQRVDVNRNNIVKTFLEVSKDDKDTLVMLDSDHAHPGDIVERLVAHDVGVVGALAFTRGAPYMPCFFYRVGDSFRPAAEWDHKGIMPCDAVGTGAIAIQRWVFKKLDEYDPESGGHYFQCTYPETMKIPTPSEDMWFAAACYLAGIPHHVDTSLCTPHLMTAGVDQEYFEMYKRDKMTGVAIS